ncbi:MAG: hypothetical protein KC620_16585, partial [Myxococcales bacterium]|nr:hypothetical protein [Myxococcales bacterium]
MNPALLAAAFALGLLSGPVVDKPWALARWGPIVATLTEAPRVDASPTRGRVVLRVDLPSVLHAQIDEVDDEWLRVRLRPLSLAGQRFPTKIGDLAGLRVVEAGEGVVDVLLRPRYPLHYTIRQRPDGIVLLIGRRSAALDGARWQPLAIGDDDTADAGPPPMTSQAELAKLHAAAA